MHADPARSAVPRGPRSRRTRIKTLLAAALALPLIAAAAACGDDDAGS